MTDATEAIRQVRHAVGNFGFSEAIFFNRETIKTVIAHIDAQAAEIDRLTASEKSAWNAAVTRDEEIERLRAVLVAAKGLNAESEEYDFDYGLGRAAPNSYWEELDDAIEAIEAIDAAKEQR